MQESCQYFSKTSSVIPSVDELASRRYAINRNLWMLEEQNNALDYFLMNEAILRTDEGKALAEWTLAEAHRYAFYYH